MFYKIEVENFHSIRERQTIDLRIARNAPKNPERFTDNVDLKDGRAPKVVAFFGANASGKSNILRALTAIEWFVVFSHKELHRDNIAAKSQKGFQRFDRFRASNSKGPTRLAVHFSAPEDFEFLSNSEKNPKEGRERRFVYEVKFDNSMDKPSEVILERLRVFSETEQRFRSIFERSQSRTHWSDPSFHLSSCADALEKLPKNCSLVSYLSDLGHQPAERLRMYFSRILSNIYVEKISFRDDFIIKFTTDERRRKWFLDRMNQDLERFDLGLEAIVVSRSRRGEVIKFKHSGLDELLPLEQESHGTREFMRIFPLLVTALMSGGIAVIDEMDQAIHALLLPEIIGWFYDPKRNPHGAQLWMSCHNPFLFEFLEKEEIYFCEKDSSGATTVYGLKNIGGVRRSDNIYKKYLGGVFGAVPRVG
ncbi:ATP-binding protein [Pararoseomonas sp. SCSIO 73927]|uniref:AAA family ATPase n=1 Tax=Pararoseomonas sp. SCSIO 73927 TaxID=3114537 RepID=UPI0030CF5518